ncbi:hypothetical protein LTS08_003824 [Lithohypha guttulata]|nr:hypothetical protein LTS08_003824 [Lithohypha guttulata]
MSHDDKQFLLEYISHEKLDIGQVYRQLLPDHKHTPNFKVQLPWLTIGGGCVEKDVRRIRNGIDFTAALEDVQEEYEEVAQQPEHQDAVSSLNHEHDVPNFVKKYLERALKNNLLQVSQNDIRYLGDSLCTSISRPVILKLLDDELPRRTLSTLPAPRVWQENDFELDTHQSLAPGPGKKQTPNSPALPKDLMLNGIESDHLSQPTTTTNERPNHGESLTSSQMEMLDSFVDWTQCSSEQDLKSDVLECADKSSHEQTSPGTPRKKRKTDPAVLAFDSITEDTITRPVPAAELCLNPGATHFDAFKVGTPQIPEMTTQLPPIKVNVVLRELEQPFVQSEKRTTTSEDVLALPFETPSIQHILSDSHVEDTASLEKFLPREKSVLRSDQMLWKEPGFKLLTADDDEQDLNSEDYCIDEWEVGTLQAQETEQPKELSAQCVVDKINIDGEQGLFGASDSDPSINQSEHKSTTEPPINKADVLCASDIPPTSRRQASFAALSKQIAKNSYLEKSVSPPQSTSLLNFSDLLSNAKAKSVLLGKKKTTRTTFSSDSLSTFLDFRGKQFKTSALRKPPKTEELEDDRIVSTQQSGIECHARSLTSPIDDCKAHPLPEPAPSPSIPSPEIVPLTEARVIVLNESLLQSKPLFIRFLEFQASDRLTLIYRELDSPSRKGPDVILDTKTCLLATSLQSLNQRPLPGQNTKTGLSSVHDHIAANAQQYDRVIVLVHSVNIEGGTLTMKTTTEQTQFTSFCHSFDDGGGKDGTQVTPYWLFSNTASTTWDLVNAWVWRVIQRFAHPLTSNVGFQDASIQPEAAAVIQDETVWELLLVKAGLNPMAAQIVIGLCKQTVTPYASLDQDWGLQRLCCMSIEARHKAFDDVIGWKAVDRLNHALQN